MNDDVIEARAALQKFFGFADSAAVLRDPVAAPWPHGRRQPIATARLAMTPDAVAKAKAGIEALISDPARQGVSARHVHGDPNAGCLRVVTLTATGDRNC